MPVVMVVDIGGTNTRVALARTEGERPEWLSTETRQIGDPASLFEFLESASRSTKEIDAAAVAVAGPVSDGEVRVVNWQGSPTLTLADLAAVGLPAGRVSLANDMVAGLMGIVAIAAGEGAELAALTEAAEPDLSPGRHLVYLAPGTGLGSATAHLGKENVAVIASEAQHTLLPPVGTLSEDTLDRLRARLGRQPSFEDVVSGRGMASLYDAVRGDGAHVQEPTAADAASIARTGLSGEDSSARFVLDLYYRALGRFAQVMALSALPCAAVVVGGASTADNIEALKWGGFAEEFHDNATMRELLESIPVLAFPGEPNMRGAFELARRLAEKPLSETARTGAGAS